MTFATLKKSKVKKTEIKKAKINVFKKNYWMETLTIINLVISIITLISSLVFIFSISFTNIFAASLILFSLTTSVQFALGIIILSSYGFNTNRRLYPLYIIIGISSLLFGIFIVSLVVSTIIFIKHKETN